MSRSGGIDGIVSKILQSKGYRSLSVGTVERVVEACVRRFGEKRAEKEAKRILHIVTGMFKRDGKREEKRVRELVERLRNFQNNRLPERRGDERSEATRSEGSPCGQDAVVESSYSCGGSFAFDPSRGSGSPAQDDEVSQSLRQLLEMHESTSERVGFMEEFYQKIWEVTGVPESVVDWGCGLQPLGRPWMGLEEMTKYVGFEIDSELVDLVNEVAGILDWPSTEARLGDLLCDDFEYAKVGFLLKVLPVLEHQRKGAGKEVLEKLRCDWLVVSFPVESVSGREKGMRDFYGEKWEPVFEELGLEFRKLEFEEELVYVLHKLAPQL